MRTAEPVELSTKSLQEPLARSDTAISCLARLATRDDSPSWIEAAGNGVDPPDSKPIPLSRLVMLAAEFGLKAERVQLDWQGLKTAVSAHPVLIVRDNSEVVVVTGGGRSGAEEVSVWDPHHDGVMFFVSREDFEHTWSGHTLLIVPRDPGAKIFGASLSSPDVPERQRPPRKSRIALGLSLGVAATAVVASVGMVLFLLTPPDGDQAAGPGTSTRVGSAGAQNPLMNRREAASPTSVAATTSVMTTPEAASISAAPNSGQ